MTSDLRLTALFFLTSITKPFRSPIHLIKSILEVAAYRIWLDQKFSKPLVVRNKKKLLDKIITYSSINSDKTLTIIEFGVAFAETANYFAKTINFNFTYHGFDTFTGLPRAWRQLPKGTFDAGGEIPFIPLSNFYFHKGLISETIGKVDFASFEKKVVLFDFDLFEPTLFALEYIHDYLQAGDVVYFDEAFDADERIVIESYFMEKFNYEVLVASVFGITFVLK